MRNSLIYAAPDTTAGRRFPTIILAVDADEVANLDQHVKRYVKRNYAVVVLVGNRFSVDPLLPGEPLPADAAKVSAQPAWQWCAEYMPYARDVVFIPDTHPAPVRTGRRRHT